MANKTLKDINNNLNAAKDYLEAAERLARKVGDTSGAESIKKVEDKVDEVREEMSAKGK